MLRREKILLLVLLALALGLRIFQIQADVPFRISIDRGIDTDWAWYLSDAFAQVSAVNADSAVPPTYNRPWITGYATAYFKLFGVSWMSLGLLNLLPGMLVVVLLGEVLRRQFGTAAALVGVLLAATNYLLVMYSRTPLIYIWVCVVEIAVGLCLTLKPFRFGLLIALTLAIGAALTLKAPVFIFAAAAFFAAAVSWPHSAWSRRYLTAMMVLALVLLVIFLGSDISVNFKQLLQGYATHWTTFEGLYKETARLGFDLQNYLYAPMPGVFALAYFACLLLALRWLQERQPPTTMDLYFVAVFIFGHGGFLLVSHRPTRFLLVLIAPAIYLCIRAAQLMAALLHGPATKQRPLAVFMIASLWAFPLCFAVAQNYLVMQSAASVAQQMLRSLGLADLGALLIGALVLLAMKTLLPKSTSKFAWEKRLLAGVSLLALPGLVLYGIWLRDLSFTWRDARRDLQQILPPHAGITGTYASSLGSGQGLTVRNITAAVKFLDAYLAAVRERRVQYLAIEKSEDEAIRWVRPDFFNHVERLETFYIRGLEVFVYRFREVEHLPESAYEAGLHALRQRRFEEAKRLFEQSHHEFPLAGAAARRLMDLPSYQGQSISLALARQTLLRSPDHPVVWWRLAQAAQAVGDDKTQARALRRAQYLSMFSPANFSAGAEPQSLGIAPKISFQVEEAGEFSGNDIEKTGSPVLSNTRKRFSTTKAEPN